MVTADSAVELPCSADRPTICPGSREPQRGLVPGRDLPRNYPFRGDVAAFVDPPLEGEPVRVLAVRSPASCSGIVALAAASSFGQSAAQHLARARPRCCAPCREPRRPASRALVSRRRGRSAARAPTELREIAPAELLETFGLVPVPPRRSALGASSFAQSSSRPAGARCRGATSRRSARGSRPQVRRLVGALQRMSIYRYRQHRVDRLPVAATKPSSRLYRRLRRSRRRSRRRRRGRAGWRSACRGRSCASGTRAARAAGCCRRR